MAGTKKAAKKSTKSTARRSRFAVRIAPPLKVVDPISIKIGVEPIDLSGLEASINRIGDLGEIVARGEEVMKSLASNKDKNRKLLHRRVVVLVYDSEGTRITHANYDLAKDDELGVTVNAEGITATTGLASR